MKRGYNNRKYIGSVKRYGKSYREGNGAKNAAYTRAGRFGDRSFCGAGAGTLCSSCRQL